MRIHCAVPGCARTRKPGAHTEFICSTHWPMTDRKLRRVMFRARKRGEVETDCMAWRKLKRQAIERAAGVGA